jgi:hypothetical protein
MMSDPASPGISDARRMATAKERGVMRRPDEHDVPPPKPFPGRKPVVLPGQIALSEEPDEEAEPAA